jgi:hypothetical protein
VNDVHELATVLVQDLQLVDFRHHERSLKDA